MNGAAGSVGSTVVTCLTSRALFKSRDKFAPIVETEAGSCEFMAIFAAPTLQILLFDECDEKNRFTSCTTITDVSGT